LDLDDSEAFSGRSYGFIERNVAPFSESRGRSWKGRAEGVEQIMNHTWSQKQWVMADFWRTLRTAAYA
jgi:hypothetical protein